MIPARSFSPRKFQMIRGLGKKICREERFRAQPGKKDIGQDVLKPKRTNPQSVL
jgi:hypothetical protein